MTVINNPSCIVVASNLGLSQCKPYPKHFKAALLLPKGTVFTDAECADLKTKLNALFIANTSARVYPVTEFFGFKDSSKEPVKAAYGYGAEQYVKRKEYIFEYDTNNGIFYANRLRSFNPPNHGYDCAFFDEEMNFWGTKAVTAGVVGFKGFTMASVMTLDNDASDGTKANVTTTVFSLLNGKEFNEDIAFIPNAIVNVELSDLKGMIDVSHTSVGGVLTISVGIQTIDDGINLYDLYSTQFASICNSSGVGGMHIIKKGGVVCTTGTSANKLVSIAANPLTKKWDITFYAGSAGTDFTHELQTPTILAAAGIGGLPNNYFEDVTITTATITAT